MPKDHLTSITLDSLDLLSLMKIVESFSSVGTDYKEFSKKIMDVIYRNFGAQRGVLVLSRDGELFMEIEKINQEDAKLLQEPLSLDKIADGLPIVLPMKLLRYITRTYSYIIIDDVPQSKFFTNEKYLQFYQPQSVLCFPIILEKEMIGIIYLESYVTKNAFIKNNVELLKLLSIQIALVLENIRMKENTKIATDLYNKLLVEQKRSQIPPKKHLPIKNGINHYLIPQEEIDYLYFSSPVTILYSEKGTYQISKSLKNVLEDLDTDVFLRIHKNYVINIHKISHIQYFINGSYIAFLTDKEETEIPIGRNYASELKNRFRIN